MAQSAGSRSAAISHTIMCHSTVPSDPETLAWPHRRWPVCLPCAAEALVPDRMGQRASGNRLDLVPGHLAGGLRPGPAEDGPCVAGQQVRLHVDDACCWAPQLSRCALVAGPRGYRDAEQQGLPPVPALQRAGEPGGPVRAC